MKGKIKATGEEVSVEKVCDDNNGTFYYSAADIEDDRSWEPHEIDVEEPSVVTIDGWVARDKDFMLRLHYTKPQRQGGGYWQGAFKSSYLPESLFPEVTWLSEPKRVRITLTPMEE